MNVLIGCEFSGATRDAFRRRGHNAWSCDWINEPEGEFPQYHYACDVREILDGPDPVWKDPHDGPRRPWDLAIFHPDCTHLAVSGARWFKGKEREQEEALAFVRLLLAAPIPRIALENPVSIISSRIRKPDQKVHPWFFGDPVSKATCLWLKNLPRLTYGAHTGLKFGVATDAIHRMAPSATRGKDRSRTFPGMANAFAEQWGAEPTPNP